MLRSLSRPPVLCCFVTTALSASAANRSPLLCLRRSHSVGIRGIGRRNLSIAAPRPRLGVVSEGFYNRFTCKSDRRFMSASAGSSAPVLTENFKESELLSAVYDNYEGVIVEMKTPMDPGVFVSSLKASLETWRQQGKKGVWIKLPISLANLVQPAVEEGFWYHHAEPSYLMLVYWIPPTKHTFPIYATHRVGVGAFIMNNKREVLVVQEKGGRLGGTGVWKIPTGVVDPGEDIYVGAIREVKEETGIDTEFVEVLAFRQSHKALFDNSDLFFICILRPLSFDIQRQESEIEAAQWMPVEEYAAQPFVQKHELLRYVIDVGLARLEKGYAGFSPVCTSSVFSDQRSYLYLNTRDLNQPSNSGDK